MKTVMEETLAGKWQVLQEQQPGIRIRNAAETLGVSEAELLATQVGEDVVRLQPLFRDILNDVADLGRVMALTRNNYCVHERKGEYLNPELKGPHVGLFVGADIDLRIFWKPWSIAFGVTSEIRGVKRHSLQFFGRDGEAVHKIYLVPKSNKEHFDKLIADYRHPNQTEPLDVSPWPAPAPEKPDTDIDAEGWQQGWLDLKDTHDFFPMMHKYGVTRTQALRLAPEGNYAVPVSANALRAICTQVAEKQVPIMVFVGNKGMIQIHSGPIKKLLDHKDWFNIMDPDFNLHLRESAIDKAWIVRKPSVDGIVTSLEVFDSKGEMIAQLFGARKPGIPELEGWREIVAEVEALEKVA